MSNAKTLSVELERLWSTFRRKTTVQMIGFQGDVTEKVQTGLFLRILAPSTIDKSVRIELINMD
jgi:hypothetical protein